MREVYKRAGTLTRLLYIFTRDYTLEIPVFDWGVLRLQSFQTDS